MALADYTALKAKMASPTQTFDFGKGGTNTPPGSAYTGSSLWTYTGTVVGTTPGAAAVCDRTTVGGLLQLNASAGEQRAWIRRLFAGSANTGSAGMSLQLCDRLVHSGGLDATLTTAQAVSTPALTRSTNGVGVMAALEIYTATGTTGTTAVMSYTNTAGTAGQVSQPITFSAPGGLTNGLHKILPISLAAADTGVKAVASVTCATTSGLAGNFGVTLYRPISPIIPCAYVSSNAGSPVVDVGGYASLVDTDACLFFIYYSNGSFLTQLAGTLAMFED